MKPRANQIHFDKIGKVIGENGPIKKDAPV